MILGNLLGRNLRLGMEFPAVFRCDAQLLPAVEKLSGKLGAICPIVAVEKSRLPQRDDVFCKIHVSILWTSGCALGYFELNMSSETAVERAVFIQRRSRGNFTATAPKVQCPSLSFIRTPYRAAYFRASRSPTPSLGNASTWQMAYLILAGYERSEVLASIYLRRC